MFDRNGNSLDLNRCHSFGRIDSVYQDFKHLEISGWVVAGDLTLDFFNMVFGLDKYTALKGRFEIESPDVAAAYPGLPKARHCRFHLKVGLDAGSSVGTVPKLILLYPVFNARTGSLLTGMVQDPELIPPQKEVDFIGGNMHIGMEFLGYLIDLVGLKPEAHVLDIGCGIGRLAIPLTRYLSKHGTYDGFDIYKSGIRWAKKQISQKYSNFNFQCVDVYNQLYNPDGKTRVAQFNMPYPAKSFDYICVISVFTHLFAAGIKHYLKEIKRMMTYDGKCFLTCFLINAQNLRNIEQGISSQVFFPYDNETYVTSMEEPEASIGFKEDTMIEYIGSAGLSMNAIYYGDWSYHGTWSENTNFHGYQDIIVVTKS